MHARRKDLLRHVRRLFDTPYEDGAAPQFAQFAVDCDSLVRHVCAELFRTDDRLPGDPPMTRTMFDNLVPTETPEPGDLAFYRRTDEHGIGHWHVMFVTERGGVVGACDVARKVVEYDAVEYCARWRLQGYRRFPLDPMSR